MRNSSSGVPPIYYHLNTAGPPQQQLTSMVRPSAHRKGLKHAFTTLYKVKSEKQEVFFFCHYRQRVSAASRGIQRQNGVGDSLDSWACTEVSICFLALTDKVPSSLLDRQLEGKRKRGVRQEKLLNKLQIFKKTVA